MYSLKQISFRLDNKLTPVTLIGSEEFHVTQQHEM